MLSNTESRFGRIEVCLTVGIACSLDPRYKDRPLRPFNAKSVTVNELTEKIRIDDDKKEITEEPTTSSNVATSARSQDRMYATMLQSC